jgi:hypothetical protein
MSLLNKYNANNPKGLWILRELGLDMYYGNRLTDDQKLLKKAIKIGPIFNTGHGQSLTYNPQTKSLWMWQDDGVGDKAKLMQINNHTLLPEKTYKVSAELKNRTIKSFKNLAFDSEGNFYADYTRRTTSNPNGYSTIFAGKIINGSVNMTPLLTIKNRPGTHSQSVGVNRVNNKLYLVSDSVFYTIPVDKLREGNLSQEDFGYHVFDTGREFEGICFDSDGIAYLLVLRGTEVLKEV